MIVFPADGLEILKEEVKRRDQFLEELDLVCGGNGNLLSERQKRELLILDARIEGMIMCLRLDDRERLLVDRFYAPLPSLVDSLYSVSAPLKIPTPTRKSPVRVVPVVSLSRAA